MKNNKAIAGPRSLKVKNGPLLLVKMDWERLGKDIRRRRIQRGITVREIAELHDLKQSSISRLERLGATCNVETLLTLTIMLDIDIHGYVFATPTARASGGTLTPEAIMSSTHVMGTA